MSLAASAFALVVLLQAATPAQTVTPTPALSKYRIVLVDGTEYVARDQFKVKGRLAVFTLLSTGRLVSIPLDTVNQQATRAANVPLPEPATPTPRKARTRIVISGTPRPIEMPIPPPADFPGLMTFAGRGNEVTSFFHLDSGLYVFRCKYSGSHNFIVHLLDEAGRDIALVANELGDAASSKAIPIGRSGRYLFNVQSDGVWSIYIEKPN